MLRNGGHAFIVRIPSGSKTPLYMCTGALSEIRTANGVHYVKNPPFEPPGHRNPPQPPPAAEPHPGADDDIFHDVVRVAGDCDVFDLEDPNTWGP
jgi:hypothetical protein